MSKTKRVFVAVCVVLAVVLIAGCIAVIFTKKDKEVIVAEVEYNPVFGEGFQEKHSLASLNKADNMSAAPYAFADTTLFSGKQITKIAAPVRSVTALDENQYFTLFVVKSSTVTTDGIYTDETYKEYKIYLPKAELASTSVEKWISVDVSDMYIYVGSDETLAFMKSDDPVTCAYADGKLYDFYYNLGSNGKLQSSQTIYYDIYTNDIVNLKGKNLSILGDSISTFSGVSNDATNANSTIGSNAVFYPKYEIDSANKTWWKQSADLSQMNVLVNNSWSGSRVLNNNGAAYLTRCQQLHYDIGDNAGTNPDIIAVYIGINDFDNKNECGTFGKLSDVYSKDTGYIEPTSFAEAYAIMVHKMKTEYGNADIFVFTLPPNGTNKDIVTLAKYNEQIKHIAEYFNCYIVDIGNIEGYKYADYTSDGLHPNELGMDLITDRFLRTLEGVYGGDAK